MPEREEMDDRITRIPEHLIETILKLSRTSRQMLKEIGREPSAEELAEKLAVRKSAQGLARQAADPPAGADLRRRGLPSRLIWAKRLSPVSAWARSTQVLPRDPRRTRSGSCASPRECSGLGLGRDGLCPSLLSRPSAGAPRTA